MAENLALTIILNAKDKASSALKNLYGETSSLSRALKTTTVDLKKLEATQKNVTGFKKNQADLSRLNQTLKDNRQRLGELGRELRNTAHPTKAQTQEFNKLLKTTQANSLKQRELRTRMRDMSAGLKQAGFDTRNMAQSQAQLTSNLQRTTAQAQQQAVALNRLSAAERRLGQSRQLQGNLRQNGAMMMAKGGIATGLIGASMRAPMQFEESFSRVTALTRLDKSNAEDQAKIDRLRNQSINLGATTSFTASEVAQGQGYLAMTGFTPDQIEASMGAVLNMTKAAGMDMGRVADISSDIAGGFNISPDDMNRVADVLTKGFTTSNTTLETFGESMKYIGPIAASSGQDFETMAAAVGILGSAGIKGSEAGTALRKMMLNLAAPPADAAKAMAELGLQAKDAQGNLRPVTDVLAEAADKTRDMGSGDRLEYFKKIFGTTAATAAMKLIEKSGEDGIRIYADTLRDSAGTAEQVAEIMADNFAGDLKNLSSSWEALRISLFDQNNGTLRGLAQGITDTLRSINAWIQANPKLAGTIFKVIAGGALFITTLGALSIALATLLGPIAITRYAFTYLVSQGGLVGKTLGLLPRILTLIRIGVTLVGKAIVFMGKALLMTPIGRIISLIALGGYLIYRNWSTIQAWLLSFWNDIKAAWQSCLTWIKNYWATLTQFAQSGVGNISQTLLNWSPIGLFYQAFAAVMRWFGLDLPAKFTDFGRNIIDGLIKGIKNGFNKLKNTWNNLANYLPNSLANRLQINSPSRIMTNIGGYIMDGLSLGIRQGEGQLSRRFEQATRLFSQTPDAHRITTEQAQRLMPSLSRPSLAASACGGDTINLTINVRSESNPQDIARSVTQALEQGKQALARRQRSTFIDKD